MHHSATAEQQLHQPVERAFDPASIQSLPAPVRRYLCHAIEPGAPLIRSARLQMRGHIKVGRWLPFRATEVLAPPQGFEWRARAALLISGFDRYLSGSGDMQWKLAGLFPVAAATGPDVSRSSAGRLGGEATWLPTALLADAGVTWTADSDRHIRARFAVDDTPVEIHYDLDPTGAVRSVWLPRWGDPDETGVWGWHDFGGDITGHRTFHGITIPSSGRFGWHHGTDRWGEGEFFRYEITALDPTDPKSPVSSHPG